MTTLLEELDTWLKTNRPDYYARLQPPWSDNQFARIQQLAGTELPASFRALYGWKGGQSALAAENLYDGWRFLQFEELRIEQQTYNELQEMGEFKQANWWNTNWIPFLQNESEALMCLDLAGTFDGKPGQLITFEVRNSARSIEFPDLDAFFTALLSGYQSAAKAGRLSQPIPIPYPQGYPQQKQAG